MYIVLPPELSRRSIQILIQYMYSGEATVSNDILNEVLHGGELLKIRGLCRNKHMSTVGETSSSTATTHFLPTETMSTCEKQIYEHPQHTERINNNSNGNLSIIKKSPVIVTSPPHMSSAAALTHKSSTTPGCTNEQEIPKKVK